MNSNIEIGIHPGPISQSLLTEQCNHRSSLIWQSDSSHILETSLVVKRFDSNFWNLYESTPLRVKEWIDLARFGGVARAGYYTMNWKLITALVERWRPETHTFHLTCGEMTITLQDIAILWGFPIDSKLWAWERIPILRHIQELHVLPVGAPYDARWDVQFDLTRIARHILLTYHDQLDVMSPSEFIWMSYINEVMELISEHYLRVSAIWSVVVPLICWEIVELHHPERCLRQFGFNQPIPTHPPLELSSMYLYHLRSNFLVDWSHTHKDSIRDWNDRYTHIASGVPLSNLEECNSQYLTWYRNITWLLIGNPRHRRHHVDGYHATGSGALILVNIVQECIRKIEETIEIANPDVKRKLTDIR